MLLNMKVGLEFAGVSAKKSFAPRIYIYILNCKRTGGYLLMSPIMLRIDGQAPENYTQPIVSST